MLLAWLSNLAMGGGGVPVIEHGHCTLTYTVSTASIGWTIPGLTLEQV